MEKDRIRYLLNQYAADQASGKEVEELFVYLRSAGGGELGGERYGPGGVGEFYDGGDGWGEG